ncbi:MAG: type transport system ATP-binding protein [Nocardioidaceae bacterium]|nr:type transport system ATP-binding protein [Nocardioidaceae bacterium]
MIVVEELTKRYGAFTAVDHVSFTVEPGSVTGFLGPNGAGKSTAMRMMVGLTPPSAGHATILGRPYSEIPNPGRQVGVLLDASAQHAGRTGREILKLGAIVMGLPDTRVDHLLEVVGLTPDEAKRRVGNYSLGMRQRLGIAHALLGEPSVLILDEPANGLDPAGIHWMRGLLRGFAERGGTVFLSSHLLNEVEIIADQLLVIGRGKIVAEGSKEDLVSQSGILVRATSFAELKASLTRAGLAYDDNGSDALIVKSSAEEISRATMADRVVLTELRPAESEGLETLFLQLTSDDARQETAA